MKNKELIISLAVTQFLGTYCNIGLSLHNSTSILILKKYMIGIYYSTLIIDLSYTISQLKFFFNIILKISNLNGKILFINEKKVFSSFIKKSKISLNFNFHIGKWYPNNLFNSKTYVNMRYFSKYKKNKFYFFNSKKIPSIALLINYRDASSLKSIVYEFKNIKIPLLSFTNTDADILAVNNWSFLNNLSIKPLSLIMSLVNKLFFKSLLISKKLFFKKIINILKWNA